MQRYIKLVIAVIAPTSLALWPVFTSASQPDQQNPEVASAIKTFKSSNSEGTHLHFKITRSLDFNSESYRATNKLLGAKYTYPQAFQINEEHNRLYILRYSNQKPPRGIIEEYIWDSGVQIGTYIIPDPQKSVSEGLVIDRSNNQTIAYLRFNNSLTRYQLIDSPDGFGTMQRLDSKLDNVAQSFFRYNDKWYIEELAKTNDTIGHSRGQYSIYDNAFTHIADVTLPAQYTGYRESERLGLPKHQGFAALKNGFAMSMGGFWSEQLETTPYHYFGINIFDVKGKLVKSKYISPENFRSQLSKLGIDVDRIENEGIQPMNDGSLISLVVVRLKLSHESKMLFLHTEP